MNEGLINMNIIGTQHVKGNSSSHFHKLKRCTFCPTWTLNCGSALCNSRTFQSVSRPLDATWLNIPTITVLFDIPSILLPHSILSGCQRISGTLFHFSKKKKKKNHISVANITLGYTSTQYTHVFRHILWTLGTKSLTYVITHSTWFRIICWSSAFGLKWPF